LDVTYICTPIETDRMRHQTRQSHLHVCTTDFQSRRITTFEILFLYPTSSSKFFSKSKVPHCSRLFLARSSKFNFIIVIPSSVKKNKFSFQIMHQNIKEQIKILRSAFQVTSSDYFNVFNFTLLLSEGQAVETGNPDFKIITLYI
jgi:hypothetical protein